MQIVSKSCFLGKIRKIFQYVDAENNTQSAKRLDRITPSENVFSEHIQRHINVDATF